MYNYLLHLRTFLIIKQKQFVNSISFRKTDAFVPFVILCEPRTGSTLLHTYLNFHPHIKSYGEVLRERIEQGVSLSRKPLYRYVFKPHATQIKAVGLKLFYSYYQHPSFQDAFQEATEKKDIRIIHLVREDELQQYVSLIRARQTKQWSAARSGTANSNKLYLDCDDLRNFVVDHYQKQHMFKSLFKEHKVITITYEQLKDEAVAVLDEVQKFLDVKTRELKSLLQKQNKKPLDAFVENYAAARKIVEEVAVEMK